MLRGGPAAGTRTASDSPPTRILVLPWGRTQTRDDFFHVNDAAVSSIKQRSAMARRDRIRIDREHATAFRPGADRDPKDILGYGEMDAIPGEGVYLCNIQWTDSGRSHWRALPDVSPAFMKRKSDGLVTELESVALCSDGEVEGLHLFSADSGTYLFPTNATMNELIIQLLKKLGVNVPPDADEAMLRDLALKALDDDGVDDEPSDNTPPDKPPEEPAAMSALRVRLERLERTETARVAAGSAAEIAEIQRTASAEGKVIPLSAEQLRSLSITPAQLRAMVSGLPPGEVPMGGGGGTRPGASAQQGERTVALSAADKHVANIFGLKEAEVAKAYAA